MQLRKHWYLGILGLVGFWELPSVIDAIQGSAPMWKLSGALWFLWFLELVPKAKSTEDAIVDPHDGEHDG